MSVLAVRSLCKAFGGVHAVNEISFDVERGEFLAMIGPNGAGKSTCFNMINGQLAPDSGEILLADKNIAGLAPREIWRLGVGRTFQVAATFGSMTVVENVQMALISHAGETYRLWRPAAGLHRERALENLTEGSLGLVFSQSVLLALVESGMSRDDAYRVVQNAARQATDERRNFRDVIEADDAVTLSNASLATIFDPQRLLVHRGRFLDALTWRS